MEVLQNTLLQLVVRQGADAERKVIVLKSGELGYTTNTERLYVGNGALSGGNVVGNLFKGIKTYNTEASPAEIGDMVYAVDDKALYALTDNDGTTGTDWTAIGFGEVIGDDHITVTGGNNLTLQPLSAGAVDADLLDSNGGLQLNSGRLQINASSPLVITGNALSVPTLELINIIYPIGSVYLSMVQTDPSTFFTGTTWVQAASGRFLVGVGQGDDGTDQQAFPVGDDTVGRYNHILTVDELASHTHDLGSSGTDTGGGRFVPGGATIDAAFDTTPLSATGGGEGHNNIPPAFGVYVFQRTG